MKIQAKKWNPQVFLELACYLLFVCSTIWFLASQKYLSYVTPKMFPYLIFAVVVLLLWSVVSCGRLFRPQYKIKVMHCLILLIPTALILFLPQNIMNSTDISGNYAGGNAMGATMQTQSQTDNSMDSAANTLELPGLDKENKKIVVANNDFSEWMSEIYNRMDEFQGYQIELTGFVFTESDILNKNEFVPARLMMTCCIADLTPVGMRAEYDKVAELEESSWVTVQGVLEIHEGENFREPKLLVKNVKPAEAIEGYIYPNY